MPVFRFLPGEKLIVNDPHVVWMKMPMVNVPGQLKLTDKRIVFIKDAHPFAVFFLFLVKSMRKSLEMEFLIGKIKNVSVREYGKEKRLSIEREGERPRIFLSSKSATFEFELKKLMS